MGDGEIWKVVFQAGGTIAMAFVVFHFIGGWRKSDQDSVSIIFKTILDRIEKSEQNFLNHNRHLAEMFETATREQQAEMKTMLNELFALSRDMVQTVERHSQMMSALKEAINGIKAETMTAMMSALKSAISELRAELDKKADKGK